MRLFDLQNDLIQSLTNETHPVSLTAGIHGNNLTTKQRLQIYRHNFLTTLTELLKNTYPMILRLVGEKFFTATAKEFLAKHLPANGDLNIFGENFSDFLATFSHTQGIAYLPAVAHFEWACHQAYYASNCLPLDLNKLQNIHPENYGTIKFTLHPSCQLLEYSIPILDIWQICQEPDNPETSVDLSTGEQKILITRPELTVNLLTLTAGEFALLSAFKKGMVFAKACTLALAAEPEFQVAVYLQKHLLAQHIVEFIINDNNSEDLHPREQNNWK